MLEGHVDRAARAAEAIFAYGSLVHPETAKALCSSSVDQEPNIFRAELHDYRRAWSVATDNMVHEQEVAYFDPRTGDRPELQVLFLNAESHTGASIDGVILPIGLERIRELDERERNYLRVDVTGMVDVARVARECQVDKIWLYVGRRRATLAASTGISAGTAVIWRDYLDRVTTAFSNHEGMLERFSAEPLPVAPDRIIDLERRMAGRVTYPYRDTDDGVSKLPPEVIEYE
ncbi:hypothetical protein GCM10020358_07650 [Amorphoplanes nipponensis]|uniref:Gamma-glutamylcyclotransferase AIG2-like domain-containing protein n=1 Tax=Actinoplanes nipponensis TaxID=135950 RepID=A0A919MG07_9ACTN|nr:hypothetical protein [Actinoplanes nipponensis]GIE48079.1 hypothetical protein Ani05nite_16130 [Actinoplanes nipponensis]